MGIAKIAELSASVENRPGLLKQVCHSTHQLNNIRTLLTHNISQIAMIVAIASDNELGVPLKSFRVSDSVLSCSCLTVNCAGGVRP